MNSNGTIINDGALDITAYEVESGQEEEQSSQRELRILSRLNNHGYANQLNDFKGASIRCRKNTFPSGLPIDHSF